MITTSQVIPILSEACPSFQSEEEIPCIALAEFTRHLLELSQRHETATFPEVARAIERLQIEGDQDVKELATIGLLETIQNVWRINDLDPESFAIHLLPESRKWWDEINAFWRGKRRYVGEGLRGKQD